MNVVLLVLAIAVPDRSPASATQQAPPLIDGSMDRISH